jgi:methionyl-tRNA formyltransferase
MSTYVIASSKKWFSNSINSELFNKDRFIEISHKDELSVEWLNKIKPKYIFFPHWHWKVPMEIWSKFECVVFHTAPLPYGRGGSPIQNLIIKGYVESPVYALKMSEGIDAGDIYHSINISLKGTIEEIFQRVSHVVNELISLIITSNIIPKKQEGDAFYFKRLSITDNELQPHLDLNQIYDRIRMVDGLDYPRSYLTIGDIRLEFSEADLRSDAVFAKVKFSKCK